MSCCPTTSALLSTQDMSEADRLTIAAGTPGIQLMERAGKAVAKACLAVLNDALPSAAPIVVLCGPGNNGGDGFVAARLLRHAGHTVKLHLLGDRNALKGDAAIAATAWDAPIFAVADADFRDAALIVDALFGAGLTRSLDGVAKEVVARVNASGVPVIAVDVPSGVDGNSGSELDAAIQATATVTFFRAKPGHYLYPGAARRGRLTVEDIGIVPEVLGTICPKLALNDPSDWVDLFPWPKTDGHKYKRGHAVVVSGGLSHTGAARLSVRAALRIGAGLATLASPSDALAVNAAQLTAVMLRVADGPECLSALLADRRKNSVVLGPGLGVGETTRALVVSALAFDPHDSRESPPRACVLDADALTSFDGQAGALAALIAYAPGPVIITPHDGEFGRLFSHDPEVIEAGSKVDRTRAASRRLGCVVLLKGADTVIAAPDGRASISAGDAPWLATAGSGDVLSGLIGGLLAQDMPVFAAANAAVYLHAAAARRFGPGLIAEDIAESLPGALRDLLALHEGRVTSNQQRKPATF